MDNEPNNNIVKWVLEIWLADFPEDESSGPLELHHHSKLEKLIYTAEVLLAEKS